MKTYKQKALEYYKKPIKGILHIGGHFGQEYQEYIDLNIENILLFEPSKKTFDVLKQNVPMSNLVNKGAGNENCIKTLNVETSNNGQSNSILKPKDHLIQYPSITFNDTEQIEIVKLDDYIDDYNKYNSLNIDTQGYELEVLKGASKLLHNIDCINVEVNNKELYEGCPMFEDIEQFLKPYGFKCALVEWEGGTWGDAFFIKE